MYSSKTFATPSGLIPAPVSVTEKLINSRSPFVSTSTSSVTVPSFVNLKALLKKFVRHCLSFVSSCDIEPIASSRLILNSLLFFNAKGAETSLIVSIIFSISNPVTKSSIFPASIFERSSMLLINERRCDPAEVIFFKSGRRSSYPRSSQSS